MHVYLSGPMRGIKEFNFPAFDSATRWLRNQGYTVVSPAEHDREVEPDVESTAAYRTGEGSRDGDPKFQQLIGWDLEQLARPGYLDGIVLLPGWQNSKGAEHELYVSQVTGKTVLYLNREVNGQWTLHETDPNAGRVIGLSGYAQSGKDTIGRALVEDHGFVRVSFAQALKDVLYAVDPLVTYEEFTDELGTDIPGMRVQEIVDAIGWEQAKSAYPEIRALLQRLGTDAGRKYLGDDIWVRTALAQVNYGDNVVFTDVRFPNEAEAIRAAGGELWRVQRPGYGPVNNHPSETAVDDVEFDRHYFNCGSIKQLHEAIFAAASR